MKPRKPIPRVRIRERLGQWPHNFNDPRSYAMKNGGQRLRGVDMQNFRRAIYQRSGGHCEVETDGKICGKFAKWDGLGKGDLYHILHRGKGGSDDHSNVLWSCAGCHAKRHPGPEWSKTA